MILGILFWVLLLILYRKRKKSEEPFLKAAGKKRRVPVRIGSTGLALSERVGRMTSRLRKEQAVSKRAGLLYSETDQKLKTANLYGAIYLLLAFGATAGILIGILNFRKGQVTRIERPDFGEEKTVTLLASIGGGQEEVEILISGKEPEESEWETVFDMAFQSRQTDWLGENESFMAVWSRLNFVREDEQGILYEFQSSAPELLSNYGTILAEDPGEAGTDVTVRVTLTYRGHEKTYLLPVHLVRSKEKSEESALEEALKRADQAGREDRYVFLPDSAGEESVSFSEKKTSPEAVVLSFFLIAIMLTFLPTSKEKEELKRREKSLESDYSKVVAGLSAYVGAGMSIRTAWIRIASGHSRHAESGSRKHRRAYLYDEMLLSSNELNSGVSEEEVYVRFGRRCGQHRYIKLGNILAQSVRQGISGLEKTLREEVGEALEERRKAALKKGEEAGTKLLVPMMLMLGIVIIILVVPAFTMI